MNFMDDIYKVKDMVITLSDADLIYVLRDTAGLVINASCDNEDIKEKLLQAFYSGESLSLNINNQGHGFLIVGTGEPRQEVA